MGKNYHSSKVTRRIVRRAYRDLDFVGMPLSPSNEPPSEMCWDIEHRLRNLQDQIDDLARRVEMRELSPARPTIVCLCGSTRFHQAFRTAALEETLAGRIVLSIGCVWDSDEALGLTEQAKADLDTLHLQKIDLADEILVLNVGGYVGQSTANEIRYARAQGKRIRWLEPVQEGGVSHVA